MNNVRTGPPKAALPENLPQAVETTVSQKIADGVADRCIVDVGSRTPVSDAELRWASKSQLEADLLPVPCASTTYLEAHNIG